MASRFRRRVVTVLLALYSVFVLVITLTPEMPGTSLVGRVVGRLLRSLHARGLFPTADYLTIEFIGNILMFIPLGVFVALLIPRRAWWTLLLIGTAFSGFIELFQALFLPTRYPEVRDLVSNSSGFLIGAAAAVALRMVVNHRDRLVERDREDQHREHGSPPRQTL